MALQPDIITSSPTPKFGDTQRMLLVKNDNAKSITCYVGDTRRRLLLRELSIIPIHSQTIRELLLLEVPL